MAFPWRPKVLANRDREPPDHPPGAECWEKGRRGNRGTLENSRGEASGIRMSQICRRASKPASQSV